MTQDIGVRHKERQAEPGADLGDAPPTKTPAPSRVLVAATLRWPFAARLAISFEALGCEVESWCPAGHPLEQTRAAGRLHTADALLTRRSLRRAIRTMQPDLIVPCDDETTRLLEQLYRRSRPRGATAGLQQVIERSLGVHSSCAFASRRGDLMRRAASLGIRSPETRELRSAAMLEAWLAEHGLPTVLKVDGSWGGQGVSVVHSAAEARAAYRRATHPSWIRALIELALRRDHVPLLRLLRRRRSAVTAQRYINGRTANRAVACWRGEELEGSSVMALQTHGDTGPATVVQAIDNADMAEASRRLVRSLGLSGFSGLDFVIEANSGAAYLIEMNPRATPICHLVLGRRGNSLPAALIARLHNKAVPARAASPAHDIVAMFPGEWRRDPASLYLRSAFHDVPWQEAALVDECVALPWEERGALARFRAWLKRAPAASSSSAFPAP